MTFFGWLSHNLALSPSCMKDMELELANLKTRVRRPLCRMAIISRRGEASSQGDSPCSFTTHHLNSSVICHPSARMIAPRSQRMNSRTLNCTRNQDNVRGKISPGASRRADLLPYAQILWHLVTARVTKPTEAISIYGITLVHDLLSPISCARPNRYSICGTIKDKGATSRTKANPETSVEVGVIMPSQSPGIDTSYKKGKLRCGLISFSLSAKEDRDRGIRKILQRPVVLPPGSLRLKLRAMADTGDSAASSPDPLRELEAEIRVLRRRIRRQGELVNLMDEQGGRRLDSLDTEIGHIREEFATALEALELKVEEAIERTDSRLQNLESAMKNLRGDEKPSSSKKPASVNPSAGTRYR